MRKLLWLLALAFPMAGAVDNARVLGVTPTQAVIAYTAPSSAACTLEVSESASYTPLVHDIDTALFASSNADSRAGNVNIGKSRTFVVGQRTVGTASDGKRYSRALQADTVHYFRVTCGADTAAGTFRTANIPLGNSRSDALLADPSSAGEYLWLTPNWVDRTGKYIDPQTGVLVRNVSLPRDATSSSDRLNQTFTSASGAAWTNSSNALADDASAATYSGSASDWMVLLKNNLSPYSTHVVDYIQVQIKGSGAGATAADRTIQACLTSDGGTTCDGDTLEIALDSTESIKTLGSSTPIYTWRPLSRVNLNTADITNNPNFGVRIRKKSASTDQISIQYAELDVYLSIRFAVSSGGDFAMFTENVTGNGFYHVGTQGAGGASSGIYAVHGETGETRWLGSLTFFSGGMKYCVEDNILWHATDPNIIYCQPASDGRLFKGTLTGNDAEAAQNSDVSATWTQVGSDTISNLIRAFYNAHSAEYEVVYDPAKYACGVQGIQNNYAMLVCRRWIQDSYGWLAVMDLTTEAIVALMPQFNCAAGRWCGQHAYDNPGHINLWYDTTHFLQGGNTGLGKYQTKLAAAITATSQTSIMVESASLWNGAWGSAPADGEPVSQYNDHYLQPMKVGDVFMIGSEYVRVTTKTSASSWVVSRGEFGSTPATYAVGAVLDAFCANTNTGNKYNTATHTVWKFLDDPYGKDTSGTTLWTNHYIGHLTARGHRIINSFNLLAIGTEGEDILNTPDPVYNYTTGGFRFAGKYAPHEGNTYQTHATMHQTKASAWERNWALDVRPFVGGNLVSYTTEGCT
ncbi:MAG TPA: hypothetical protein VLE22_12300, partial [Bryobacteraceae bacterium]|nr:hypothetical protein [Bryobacteraceae bacterium]